MNSFQAKIREDLGMEGRMGLRQNSLHRSNLTAVVKKNVAYEGFYNFCLIFKLPIKITRSLSENS